MLIIGCGYVGYPTAMAELGLGHPVTALTRSPDRAQQWQAAGINPVIGDITSPTTLSDLQLDDDGQLLFAVGFDRSAGHSIDSVYGDGLRNVLDHLAGQSKPLKRLVYLSSTGVYGNHDGQWVDEETPPSPERAGGKACLAAEELLANHAWSSNAHVVLRLAGIYGAGRVPRLNDIRAGLAIPAPENTWLNLIHLTDIVNVIQTVFAAATPSTRYCVSDGNPVRRHDYYNLLAELSESPTPTLTRAPNDSPAAARAASDKRISNQRMLKQLRVSLKHADCRSGLSAILAGGSIQ